MAPEQRAVLIVEDDVTLGKSLARAVATNGLEVDSAGTVAEAKQKLSERRYHVLVLDLILPDGNGRAVIEYLKSRSPALELQVVIITGANADHLSGLDRSIVKSVLFKPLNVENLAAYVHVLSLR